MDLTAQGVPKKLCKINKYLVIKSNRLKFDFCQLSQRD